MIDKLIEMQKEKESRAGLYIDGIKVESAGDSPVNVAFTQFRIVRFEQWMSVDGPTLTRVELQSAPIRCEQCPYGSSPW